MPVADATVVMVEIYGLNASNIFIARGTAKHERCSVKKWLQAGKVLQCRTA
jgi:hypothetical protein